MTDLPMARRLLPTMLEYTETTVSWRSLGHQQPRLDEVLNIVRGYHRDSLLTVLVRLNLALTHPRGPTQAQIVRRWVVPEIAGPLLEIARRTGAEVVFHEGQVLNLIRLALLHSPRDEGARLTAVGEFGPLTQSLLMVTDLMFPFDRGDRRGTAFAAFTRSEVFLHDEDYLPNTMARCYDLFIGLPELLSRQGERPHIPTVFRQITGLDLEDYLALGFCVLAHYDSLDPSQGDAPIGVRRPFPADSLLSVEIRELMWNRISLPLDRYRTAIEAEWNTAAESARWSAMRVFFESPMLEFTDGTVVCLSRRLLRDRFTQGIYWILANAMEGRDRDHFTEFFGDIFEEYVRRCFLRSLGRAFYAKATYGRPPRPLVDGALATRRSLGLVECKAGRLLLRARERGAEGDLQASVERMLERAASQLWEAIQAGQDGQLQHLGVTPQTRYYPIVITYEPLPAHPFALKLYDRILYGEGRLRRADVRPVTLLNARDVESLEAIIGAGEQWPDLLFRKHSPRFRFLPFHNYVYERFAGRVPRNPYLHARWGRIGEIMGMRLMGEPLRAPEVQR